MEKTITTGEIRERNKRNKCEGNNKKGLKERRHDVATKMKRQV